MDNSSINALLQVYNAQVQDNINQINSYGLNIQANDLITALKNSYVNLVDLAKNLALNNSSQYTSYTLPYTMSIREVCFNNNLDFDNIDVIQNIIAANPGKFVSTNRIIGNTVLMFPKH
ncbi:MAG: hypothetical protein ACK5Z5_09055 [Neisseriaceae bacterium]|jgi:phage-related protein